MAGEDASDAVGVVGERLRDRRPERRLDRKPVRKPEARPKVGRYSRTRLCHKLLRESQQLTAIPP
jgi:hypothetical protein